MIAERIFNLWNMLLLMKVLSDVFWRGIARLHIVSAKQKSNMKEFGSVTGDVYIFIKFLTQVPNLECGKCFRKFAVLFM